MERVNQELEQYLHLFINQRQDDWVGLLPFTEFQYNNQVHSSTQHPPFLLDTRHVRGCSALSDVSSDISPSPLYIPPHGC